MSCLMPFYVMLCYVMLLCYIILSKHPNIQQKKAIQLIAVCHAIIAIIVISVRGGIIVRIGIGIGIGG